MLVDNAKLKKDDAGFMQVKVVMGTVKVNGAGQSLSIIDHLATRFSTC